MGEINGQNVEDFTAGRLDGSDAEVQRMLSVALTTARRYVGWSVSPVTEGAVVVLDGPDSRILWLPTRKLVALNSVEEDGTTLDLSTLTWTSGGPPGLSRPAAVRKRSKGWWSDDYESIIVDMDHGYTEVEAVDWRHAIMSMVDQMSLVPVSASTGYSPAGLSSKRVDDVTYQWAAPYMAVADEVLYSVAHILDDYKLPTLEFM